ncbi:class C sortase [Enterococcus sp. LJL90]
MRWFKIEFILKLLMSFLFLAGVAVFSYPFVVDGINNVLDQYRIASYQKEIAADEKQQQKLAEMKQQNADSSKKSYVPGMGEVVDPFEAAVSNTIDPTREYFESHTIGAIYIPAINVSLPLFDETNEALLEKGATHLQGTSFPVGGNNTHAVITGHTGIPEKMLFTDLDKLNKEDKFYIDVLGERFAYQIFEIQVVLPEEIESLAIREGAEIVTLLTCTPYSINSHRLLVTGKRIPYRAAMSQEIKQAGSYHSKRLIGLLVGLAIFLAIFAYWLS